MVLQKIPVGSSRKMITLYKNGENSNIYYYFTWEGKVYRGSTGTDNLSLSIDKSYDIFHKVKTGMTLKLSKKITRFEDVAKKFINQKEHEGLSIRTLTEYKRQIKFLIEKFKGTDIETFGSKSIYLEYQEWRRKYYVNNERVQVFKRGEQKIKGRKWQSIGNSTLNRECRLLVSILRFSKEYLDVLKNKEIKSYHDLKENIRSEILTKKEYLRLKEYWNTKNQYYWMIISFVNNTGIRYPSELNRITWGDINFEKSYIMIRERKSKKSVLNTPIPMVGNTRNIIESLWNRDNIDKEKDNFVFVDNSGKQIKNISKSFKESLIRCGIDKKLTMYSLRHLYTTRMVKRPDIPLSMISYTLGHKDTVMVEKRYSHLRVDDIVSRFQISEKNKQERKNKKKTDE